MSYRSAKRLKLRIIKVRSFLDKVCEPPSRWFGLCGHGKRHNWSVIAAEFVFNPCACCLVWRGFALGLVCASIVSVLLHGGR